MAPTVALSDYLALFRHLPGRYLLLAPEAPFVVLDRTQAYVRAAGEWAAELGQPVLEALAPVSPPDQSRLLAVLEDVRREPAEQAGPGRWYPRRAGSARQEPWQLTLYPVLSEKGELRCILLGLEAAAPAEALPPAPPALADDSKQALQVLEALPVMLWTTRPDGTMEYQNPYWLCYTGQTLAQALERGWMADVYPDDRARVQQAWQQAQLTGQDYEIEHRLRRHDGQYRWVLVRALVRRNAQGEAVGWVGTGTDIHALKQAQQQLARQDRQLHQILQQVPAHIATLSGPDHIYTFMNERSAQLFGGTVELGVPAAQARPELVANGYINLINNIYRKAQPFVLHEMPMAQPPAPDGSTSTLYFDGTIQPLTDEQGRTEGILVFGIDVTERVLARQRTAELMEEIRLQDAQFKALVESLPVLIYITDAEVNMLYINPQHFAYTGRDAGTGLAHWEEDVHPDDMAPMRAAFAAARHTGQPWTGEYRLRRHDGQYRWHLTHGVPLRRPDGSIIRWYGSSVDIHDAKLLQQQLEAKDAQLLQILSQVPAYIATVAGPEHRFTFATPNYHTLMGGRVQLGQPAAALLPEVEAQGFIRLLDTVYETALPYVGRETLLHVLDPATGGTRTYYLDFVYQPLYDEAGQAQGILAFGVDVTAQVLARQRADALAAQVHRSEERLRRMTEALPNIIFIDEAAGAGHYVSPQWQAYTGLPEGASLATHWREVVHPADLGRVEQQYAQARAESRGWRFELRFRGHDGQYRWFLNQAQPELDAAGQVLRWYGSNTDIHDQKELTEALRQSEEHFRFLSESVPQIIWTAQADGQVEYFNQRVFEVTGFRPAECLGAAAWTIILHPDDRARTLATWQNAYEHGTSYEIEYRFVSRAGGYRWFLGRAEPLRTETGEVSRWFGSCTDIEDVKQAQQLMERQNAQLVQTNQALDNFVYTASHDLKQPITNMAGIFEELKRTATFHDEAANQLISMFEGALQQINTTIQNLSDVVQVQRQHEQLPLELLALAPFAQEIVQSLHEQVEELHAQLTFDFEACPALWFVRPNLRSILYNLLSNALKYADPNRPPQIRVTSAREDHQAVLTVQDNGLGINLERHGQHLFQMFRRFHYHVDGSGVGLYLVNRMVQQAGGHLEVESQVNQGTMFRLRLPQPSA